MTVKHFMLGFGCGLILLAAVIFFYGYARADNGDTADEPAAMSDGEIIARARELGMVSYMDFVRDNGGPDETEPVSDEPAEEPVVENEPAEPEIVYVEIRGEPSDIEIIARARALGMSFAGDMAEEEPLMPETADETDITDENEPAEIIAVQTDVTASGGAGINAPNNTDALADLSNVYTGELINVYVPSGSNANAIAGILYDNGVVADQGDFVSFIVGRGMAARLMSGPFSFYGGMAYEDILYILRGYRGR